ncbi:hypothetical protein [uncultured Phenylobacterium sp.]|uniref:hypothetical protein n=1 Tax=uncultured Phenylobacterium sp. TaxID=349273 RepID=UPI0025D9FBA4|nr:hypothetical protein [uncultured Phenylobacterium sp.]
MRWIVLSSVLLLAGCSSTGAGPKSSLTPQALSITYQAPKTRVAVEGDLTLINCEPVRVISSLSLNATGVADPAATFTLDGKYLSGAFTKRDVKVELNENRTLKSINTSVSDRTGAVITNLFKTVGSIVTGVRALEAGSPTVCNPQTLGALKQAEALAVKIDTLRAALATNAAPRTAVKDLDALAAQLAWVRTNQLTLKASRTLTLPASPDAPPLEGTPGPAAKAYDLRWTLADLGKWFARDPQTDPCTPVHPASFAVDPSKQDCELVTGMLSLTWSITGIAAPDDKRVAASPCLRTDASEAQVAECRRSLVVTDPVISQVTVATVRPDYIGHGPGETLAQASVPVVQYGTAGYIPLDVGFAKSRVVAMTFDQFGRRQTFSWTSEASAENATAALNDIATAGAATAKILRGDTQAEAWTKENARLETQMKNNLLKSCQAAIQAGATACPAPPAAAPAGE